MCLTEGLQARYTSTSEDAGREWGSINQVGEHVGSYQRSIAVSSVAMFISSDLETHWYLLHAKFAVQMSSTRCIAFYPRGRSYLYLHPIAYMRNRALSAWECLQLRAQSLFLAYLHWQQCLQHEGGQVQMNSKARTTTRRIIAESVGGTPTNLNQAVKIVKYACL